MYGVCTSAVTCDERPSLTHASKPTKICTPYDNELPMLTLPSRVVLHAEIVVRTAALKRRPVVKEAPGITSVVLTHGCTAKPKGVASVLKSAVANGSEHS